MKKRFISEMNVWTKLQRNRCYPGTDDESGLPSPSNMGKIHRQIHGEQGTLVDVWHQHGNIRNWELVDSRGELLCRHRIGTSQIKGINRCFSLSSVWQVFLTIPDSQIQFFRSAKAKLLFPPDFWPFIAPWLMNWPPESWKLGGQKNLKITAVPGQMMRRGAEKKWDSQEP